MPAPTLLLPLVPDPGAMDDGALLRLCRAGDARAWRALVRRYTGLVLGVPRAMRLQASDADEVFQLTFAALHRALPELRDPSRIEAWLVTTARRAALRLLRDRRRHGRLMDLHLAELQGAPYPAADESFERLAERERVARALDSLAEPCRSLLTALFSDQGGSYREIATHLGVAIGSLGPQRARCLAKLRRRLLPPGEPATAAAGAATRRGRRRSGS